MTLRTLIRRRLGERKADSRKNDLQAGDTEFFPTIGLRLAIRKQAARIQSRIDVFRGEFRSKITFKKLRAQVRRRKNVSGTLRRSISRDDTVILVMGGIGTGKSTFISALMGQDEIDVNHGLESHTKAISSYEVLLADGSRFVVTDTPGFGDTDLSELEILELIVAWLSKLYNDGILLKGIVFFHRITDNRMAGSSLKSFNLLRALSGDEATQNLVLVTSMWDIVDKDLGDKREKDIEENFWKAALDKHARQARFDRTSSSAHEIIKMLDMKQPVVMEIQREIIERQLPLSETAAGSIVSSRLAQLEKEQLKELEAAREELARAREQGSKGMSKMVTKEIQRMNTLRAELQARQCKLQAQKAQQRGRFQTTQHVPGMHVAAI